MANVFRENPGGRLKVGNLVQLINSGASHLIANEFWNYNVNPGKKIAVTLKNSAGAVVANTQVKFAVMEFSEAIPFNPDFMQLVSKGVYTTDASGNIQLNYTGIADIGGYAYLAILHPNSSPTESVIWKVTIS